MYSVEVITSFEEIYRYTTTLMCESLDASQQRACVALADDGLADGGEFLLPQCVAVEIEKSFKLRIIVYVLCHTFPAVENVAEAPPFEVELRVSRGGEVVYNKLYSTNQWGGLTLDVVL